MNKAEELAKELKSFRNNRVDFVKKYLKITPDAWQQEALRALDDNKNLSVKSGHGVGKTAFLSWVILHGLTCFPFPKIPCTAPTNHQLSDILWAELGRWLAGSKLKYLFDLTATKLTSKVYPEWFAVARACSKPENLAGFHAPKLIYIIDEASGVPDSIFEVIEGALTTENSQVVMTGNPTLRSGYFFNSFHKYRSGFYTMTVSSENSERVSPEYTEGIASRWGVDSDVYRVRVLGEFPAAEPAGFFPLPIVENAVQRWHETDEDGDVQIGLDVARYGDDKTVFAIRKGDKLIRLEDHLGWSVAQTAAKAAELCREYKAGSICVDDTGVGGGVTDLLKVADVGKTRVVPVNFGGQGDEHYANKTALMAGNLKDRLINGTCALPDDIELVAQLTTRQYALNAQGKIVLERKEDMKRRGLPSPDKADAVFLAFNEERLTQFFVFDTGYVKHNEYFNTN